MIEFLNTTNQSSPFYLAHESFVTFFETRDCVQVHDLPWEEKCNFTKHTIDCRVEERIFDYTSFIFCGAFPSFEWISKLFLVSLKVFIKFSK